MKRYLIVFFILLLIVLLTISTTIAVVFYIQANNRGAEIEQLKNEIELLNSKLENNGGTDVTPTPTDTSTVTPTVNLCLNKSNDGAIVVTKPCKNQKLTSPLNIKGVATGLFEGTMIVELYDATDNLVHKQVVTVTTPDIGQPGNFDISFPFTPPTPP